MDCNTAEFIDENIVKLKIATPLGKVTKYVTFDSYVEALINAKNDVMPELKNKNVIVTDTPIFPSMDGISVIRHRMFSDGNDWTVLLRENMSFDMPWAEEIFENAGIPKLLFAVKRIQGKFSTLKIAALYSNTKLITEDTKIYYYPFTNVGTPYSGACLSSGNVALINKVINSDLISLYSLPNMFLDMPATNHSYKDVNLSGLEMRPLLDELKNKPFPDEWLKPAVPFGEWFNTFN